MEREKGKRKMIETKMLEVWMYKEIILVEKQN